MRNCLILLAIAVLCTPSFGGGPERGAVPALELLVSGEGGHFQYSITHVDLVRQAWIEVVDRPAVIDKKAVAVQASGEFDWEWDHAALNDWEQDEDELKLSLWDPDGETIFCEGTTMYLKPGGEVSPTTVSGRTRFTPEPRLNDSLVRVNQGSSNVTFPVTGSDLTPTTVLHVFSEKAGRCQDRFVHTEVLDLADARVTVDSECLRKAGILFLSASSDPASYEDYKVWIHVASRTSPVLRAVSPSQAPADQPQNQLALVLRGSRFTENSQVYAGYLPSAGALQSPQTVVVTEYVSPTMLRAAVNSSYTESLSQIRGQSRTALRIWVEGDEDKFELSEPRDVQISFPSGQRPRTPAVITSVSPFPIPLMNQHSPEELKVTIHGENFVPENKVMGAFGNSANNARTLKTEYVSPTTLRTWIPRQYWRKHRLAFRLVVETANGQQYKRQVESREDE